MAKRISTLQWMDTHIRETIGDDDITDYWDSFGIADGANETDYREIAEDDDIFKDVCFAFAICIKMSEE